MMEEFEAGSVLVTNGSGYGSERPRTYGYYGSGSETLLIRLPEAGEARCHAPLQLSQ
jgi:hypothetical protein